MKLIHIKGDTYYFDSPVCVGVYFLNKENAIIFDSGSDKDHGRKILKYFQEKDITLKAIINTHSHADHCGGNKYLQERTGCGIYATSFEGSIINNPELEPIYLYSSNPINELKSKFLMAQQSIITNAINYGTNVILDNRFEIIDLSGHSPGMIGIKTDDDVTFVADSLFEDVIIEKYKILYCMDVSKTFTTLNRLNEIKSDYFVLSHGGVKKDITNLIKSNFDYYNRINNIILGYLDEDSMTKEEILSRFLNEFNLKVNIGQYFLNSSALSSHLAYLSNKKLIVFEIKENKLYWKK